MSTRSPGNTDCHEARGKQLLHPSPRKPMAAAVGQAAYQQHLVTVVCKVALSPPTAVHGVEAMGVRVRPALELPFAVRECDLALASELGRQPNGVAHALPVHHTCTRCIVQ